MSDYNPFAVMQILVIIISDTETRIFNIISAASVNVRITDLSIIYLPFTVGMATIAIIIGLRMADKTTQSLTAAGPMYRMIAVTGNFSTVATFTGTDRIFKRWGKIMTPQTYSIIDNPGFRLVYPGVMVRY